MEITPELDAVVDHLREQHPSFRRTTIERLVLRTARELATIDDGAQLSIVLDVADERLAYANNAFIPPPARRDHIH